MKSFYSLLTFLLITSFVMAQKGDPERYGSAAFEINFSSAKIIATDLEDNTTSEGGNKLRFAPWFNLQMYGNTDYKNHGYFLGFTIRNIGFIYQNGNERWICRNYALGIPLGIKFGDMKHTYVYAGYEFEVPINYRERYYRNDSKERVFNVWFSDRVNPFTHAGMVGFNFKSGFNVKFKYYFTEFFNKSFNNESIDDPRDIRYPGNGLDVNDPDYKAPRPELAVNIFYVSVSWNMFRKPYYYTHYERQKSDEVY